MSIDELPEGNYDAIITQRLRDALATLPLQPTLDKLDASETADAFSAHLARVSREALLEIHDEERRLHVVNDILTSLGRGEERISEPRRLVALRQPSRPGTEDRYPERATTPLGRPGLLTNTPGEPAIGHEIRGELLTADRIDLLCAFVMWPGIRTLEKELGTAARRGVSLRVIASTYTGCTDRGALDRLVRDYGAQVKISYETNRTRLHAKSWIFHRNSGHHTAYVGSSNLSRSALLDGLEWNVRLTQAVTPALINKMGATFETYWNDPAFESYDPDTDAERLDAALLEAGGGKRDRVTLSLSGLEVRPYPHQQQVLEDLEVERTVRDHHRNLVVAATGTGKTVIAALDYKRLCEQAGRRLSLLFVAHRREILSQSLRTYREVLADNSFGELLVGTERPERWKHVFASVQSLKPALVQELAKSDFDVIVIDEFHHASAPSYQAVLEQMAPRELLGLTATPERADGKDVRMWFDGRTASEIRLWDALQAELLCPFHYFGVDDGTDLSGVTWARGRYDAGQLDNLFTGNDARARIVLSALRDKVMNIGQMRALGFCVGVQHAAYMARVFNEAGIPAVHVSGATPQAERDAAIRDLRDRKVNAVFTADLFNEGLDIPDVDTVLFLRPTESSTIFLQQLGRGLRRTPDKPALTVLDFVGNQNQNFRYDVRFSAMTGLGRGQLERHAKSGFPTLPSGCQILLDRQSEKRLLESLRSQVRSSWRSVVEQLRALGPLPLQEFLAATGITLDQVIKGDKSWARAQQQAGFLTEIDPGAEWLLTRGSALAHVDDQDRAAAYLDILTSDTTYPQMEPQQQRYARMLLFALWPSLPFSSFEEALTALRAHPVVISEFTAILDQVAGRIAHVPARLTGELAWSPLRSHARYSREEICAALDWADLDHKPSNMREGVMFSRATNTDALLVTLHKEEDYFGPTTMYDDYAVSPDLFHWESQSTTSLSSPTGRRYTQPQDPGHHILLFSRSARMWEFGKGAPYLLLGPVEHVSHEGERPIAITWKLQRRMPQDHFHIAGVESA